MVKHPRYVTLLLCVFGTPVAYSDVPFTVFSTKGLELSEEEKLEIIESPRRLTEWQDDRLLQAVLTDPTRVRVFDESDARGTGSGYSALLQYGRISLSETRFVNPKVVCEWGGSPLLWKGCTDNSRFAMDLPGRKRIWINDTSTTDDEYVMMLDVIDQAELRTPNDVLVTSDGVNHILLRSRRSGVYVLIGDTTSREPIRANLKRSMNDDRKSYELVDWSCGDPRNTP